jgi:hypothetical protein
MEASDWVSGLAVATALLVVLGSGPLGAGLVQPSGTPTTVGDGNATVATLAVTPADLHVSSGRFGTYVEYLRVPDARVDLAAVTGHPRVVYRVQVPALDADLTGTEIVTDRGRYTLGIGDYGLDPDAVSASTYEGRVTVRIQSFAVDRTVYARNVTVEVRG